MGMMYRVDRAPRMSLSFLGAAPVRGAAAEGRGFRMEYRKPMTSRATPRER